MKDVTRGVENQTTNNTFTKWNESELQLNQKFMLSKENVHAALCGKYSTELTPLQREIPAFLFVDNIDTRSTLEHLRDLVSSSNLYIRDNNIVNTLLLHDIAIYITKLLTIFGTISKPAQIGFPISTSNNVDVLLKNSLNTFINL